MGLFFLLLLTKFLSNCPSSKKIPLPWKIFGWAPAVRHYLICKMLYLKCLTVFRMRLCLDNCSVICTVTSNLYTASDIFRILVYSKLCLFSYMRAYSSLLLHAIQAYLAPCVTLVFSQPRHIPRALTYLEPEAYSKLCETLTRHIQNSVIVWTVYSEIIQPYTDTFRTFSNAYVCRNLA